MIQNPQPMRHLAPRQHPAPLILHHQHLPCTAAPLAQQAGLVFKGCDAANVAAYYDKSECVRDNTTGLIWQGQTPAGTGLRANDEMGRTNYNGASVAQKWNGITLVNPTQADIDNATNATGFKNAINATNLCGFNDWRLPSKDELFGLVKPALSPKIDTTWFVNFSTTTAFQRFWTATQAGTPNRWAWSIYFDSGTAEAGNTVCNYLSTGCKVILFMDTLHLSVYCSPQF
ncbi:MAG: DUF1566 domain-containing protein [Rhodoferax sp.]|nr:DUF1566 domain-containing protein [Rhodoferax sp.]